MSDSPAETTSLYDELHHEVTDALQRKRLTLPTLPEVALKVRKVMQDDNSVFADMVHAIAGDAALSARLIQVANSPLLRTSQLADTLELAISRLGMKMTRDLVCAILMEQMFQARSPSTEKRLREVWHHSVLVGALSHAIAKHFTHLDPGQALLAGLVHEIGFLPILTRAEQHPEMLKDEKLLNRLLRDLHEEVGGEILSAWSFPPELVRAAREHEDLKRDTAEVDYVDVVIIANLQSYIGTDHPMARFDTSQVPAFAKLGLPHDVNLFELEQTKDDIEEACAMLRN